MTVWGSDDPGVINNWTEWGDTVGWGDVCPDGSEPLITQKNGREYPSCLSTGVVYAPPFTIPALVDLVFPDDWSVLPPG